MRTYFLFLLAVLFCALFIQFIDADFYVYLATGIDFIRHGASLFRDHYSLHFDGELMKEFPWLFALLLGVVHEFFGGLWGVVGYRILLFSIPFFIWYRHLRQKIALSQLEQFTFLLIFLCCQLNRSQMRPEVFTIIFSFIFSLRCLQIYKTGKIDQVWSLILALPLWMSLHSTAAIGYATLGTLFLALSLPKIGDAKNRGYYFKRVVGYSTLMVIVGFISANPLQSHPLLAAKFSNSEWVNAIEEFDLRFVFSTQTRILTWCLFSLLLMGSLWVKNLYAAILTGTFMIFGLQIQMLFTPIAVILLPHLVEVYLTLRERLKAWQPVQAQSYITTALVVIAGLYLHSLYSVNYSFSRRFSLFTEKDFTPPYIYPVGVADYMNANSVSGRVYGDIGASSYLIYKLETKPRVFIDIRTDIVYPYDHFLRGANANVSPNFMISSLGVLSIDHVVGLNTMPFYVLEPTFFDREFTVQYVDENFTLLSRKPENFPLATLLMFDPQCLESMQPKALEQELIIAQRLKSIGVENLLMIAKEALNQPNLDLAFFTKHRDAPFKWSERLLGYLALKNARPLQADYFFRKNIYSSDKGVKFGLLDYYYLLKVALSARAENAYLSTLDNLIGHSLQGFYNQDGLQRIRDLVSEGQKTFPNHVDSLGVIIKQFDEHIQVVMARNQKLGVSPDRIRSCKRI